MERRAIEKADMLYAEIDRNKMFCLLYTSEACLVILANETE